VKPYKKIGEEAESDHGTDNEADIHGKEGIELTKKKRVCLKKKKQISVLEEVNKTTVPKKLPTRIEKNRMGTYSFNNDC
jgi:hypothetical protein